MEPGGRHPPGAAFALQGETVSSLRRFAQQWEAQQRRQRGERPVRLDRYRSDLERRYAQRLDLELRAGAIQSWKYEAVTLRLADGARYTPQGGAWSFEDVGAVEHSRPGARGERG